jgi:glycosyltransferase involved in cell wall biosynthesis
MAANGKAMSKRTRTFMLGWEFPPFISGGLGTACYGLTKAMDKLGVPIIFVLPRGRTIRFSGEPGPSGSQEICEQYGITQLRHVTFRPVSSTLEPYARPDTSESAEQQFACTSHGQPEVLSRATAQPPEQPGESRNYGTDIYNQVHHYAESAARIAQAEDFEIIHAHDWMTFPAGALATKRTGRPLIVHVHSTEFDRSGEHVNQSVYDLERQGMHTANKVIAVSNYTRNIILDRYGVSPDKVEVVYNGVECDQPPVDSAPGTLPPKRDRVVLFLGRITMQKGPEYFLRAAKRVLEKIDNVKFVMAGDGDLLHRSIELVAELQIGHKVYFTGFLHGHDVRKAYETADLYVMPSVSEPFGIAALEALRHNVPVLISKQSGVGETLRNALKVDFWDVDEMANKMVAVLKHPSLDEVLSSEGCKEAGRFRWERSAVRVLEIYDRVLHSS